MRFKPDTESRGLENGKTVAERRETTSNVWEMAAGAAVKRTVVGAAAGRMSVGTCQKEEKHCSNAAGMYFAGGKFVGLHIPSHRSPTWFMFIGIVAGEQIVGGRGFASHAAGRRCSLEKEDRWQCRCRCSWVGPEVECGVSGAVRRKKNRREMVAGGGL